MRKERLNSTWKPAYLSKYWFWDNSNC